MIKEIPKTKEISKIHLSEANKIWIIAFYTIFGPIDFYFEFWEFGGLIH